LTKNLITSLPIYRNAADIPPSKFRRPLKTHFVVVKTKNTPVLLVRGLSSLKKSILSTNPRVKPTILVVDDSDNLDLLAANSEISREHSASHHPVKARFMRQMLKGNGTKPIDILCRDYNPDRRIKKPYGGWRDLTITLILQLHIMRVVGDSDRTILSQLFMMMILFIKVGRLMVSVFMNNN
jgi:hypothetical protein